MEPLKNIFSMCMRKTIIVAMSGGVDSSVVAYLLKKQTSAHIVGLFMKNWEETDDQGTCSSAKDFEDVEKVAAQLGIPHYTVSFAQEYKQRVFSKFLQGYSSGLTPNPDVLCNREIKFDLLQKTVKDLGGDFLATGHYCRMQMEASGACLLRGVDNQKDQSYFLCATPREAFHNVLFPIGGMKKTEVRALAEEAGLVTAEKKDSTGICFIGKRHFKTFLEGFIPNQEGELIDYDQGKVVGTHEGAHYYTIGQRKGLRIGGAERPYYVVGKDMATNVVYVVQGEDHPLLHREELLAKEVNWLMPVDQLPSSCTAKVRYRSPDEECSITYCAMKNEVRVRFSSPVKAVTPGQTIAFYSGERCLGGGVIDIPMILPQR